MGFLAQIGAAIASLFIATLGFFHPALAPLATSPAPVIVYPASADADNSDTVQPTQQNFLWIPVSQIIGTTAYSQTDTSVYFDDSSGKVSFPFADPRSFVVAADASGTPTGYAKDATHVYYAFQGWGTDSTGVSSGIMQIQNADAPTFTLLYEDNASGNIEAVYAKDTRSVYDLGKIIPDADPNTFEIFAQNGGLVIYMKDKNHVYLGPDAFYNPPSGQIALFDGILQGADATSFEVFSSLQQANGIEYDAQDKNHKYYLGQIVQ